MLYTRCGMTAALGRRRIRCEVAKLRWRMHVIQRYTLSLRSSRRKPSNNRFFYGLVSSSRRVRYSMASVRFFPHISSEGCSEEHTAGRAGSLKIRQRIFSSRCMHAVPAGFPSGMPGIGDDMEGAVQHAPQCGRQRNFSDVTMFSSCKHIQFIKLFCGEGICCDHCRHHGLFCGIFHQFHAVKG